MRKLVFVAMLSLLIVNMLTLTPATQPVKAWTGSIKILPDGSVSPSDAPIQRNGNLYTLTDNITSIVDGITIMRKNMILDGAGYIVQGPEGNIGILLYYTINVTVRNIEVSQFYYGIILEGTSYSNISGNKITTADWGEGIYIESSSSHNIIENNILTNNGDGIRLWSSGYNIISRNTIINNLNGITGEGWSNNKIIGNVLRDNMLGIYLGWSSNYNTIALNNIKNHYCEGISMWSSSYNTIFGNDIVNNNRGGFSAGIVIGYSSCNNFFHNNIINNGKQIDIQGETANTWDDGYPSGGNCWSDYGGVDLNNDGIGDTPYVIDADNIDRYPHMTALALAAAISLQPITINTQVNAEFSLNIMAYGMQNLWAWQAGIQWNSTMLEYVSYSWGEFQTLAGTTEQSPPTIDTVIGRTSKPALESALRGSFAPVSAVEIKLLTITFKVIKTGDSSIRLTDVSLRSQNSTGTTAYPRWSDVDADGVIDSDDVTLTKQCWEDGYYDPAVDFNDDDTVDITDIAIVTSDFGKHDTDPEWGVTNTICGIPSSTMTARVHAIPSEAYISVPYHRQITSYFCGPAALEMVFDFYGPDIGQNQIADVARTTPDGTYTFDMVRASHFSNLSLSPSGLLRGYTLRNLGYAAFERGGMTMDDLKSLILMGYPVIVLVTWHFRVAVGYNSTHITFQDSFRGPMYNVTYSTFDTEWDYSGHWGLFVSPWDIRVSNVRNVLPGEIFTVEASVTYPCPTPFSPDQYPTTQVNATITLPNGLSLVPGETAKKPVTDYLTGGESANVMWTVQAQSLGNYAISVEAEGKVNGFVPPLPDFPEYFYQDRIGGAGQSLISVTSTLDESSPITSDDYDGIWHNQNFRINLTAQDDNSGVKETYYRINNGPTKTLDIDGQPYITTEGANNTLEYWSTDWAGNEEVPHKFLSEIGLDKTKPVIGEPSRIPSGDIQPSQDVKIAVSVTDVTRGIKNVTLFYTITNGFTWEKQIMDYNISTCLYEATIPRQPDLTVVEYKVVAYDKAGNVAVEDNLGKYYTYQVKAIYELTITTSEGGTTNPVLGKYFYQSGTVVSVTAIPESEFKFNHWKIDDVAICFSNPFKISMNKNHTMKAVFFSIRPVGGHSFLIEGQTTANPLTLYLILMMIFAAFFTISRRMWSSKRC